MSLFTFLPQRQQRRRLPWQGRILRHKEILERILERKIIGKRRRGAQTMAFIKQPRRDVWMQAYLRLKRAAGYSDQRAGTSRLGDQLRCWCILMMMTVAYLSDCCGHCFGRWDSPDDFTLDWPNGAICRCISVTWPDRHELWTVVRGGTKPGCLPVLFPDKRIYLGSAWVNWITGGQLDEGNPISWITFLGRLDCPKWPKWWACYCVVGAADYSLSGQRICIFSKLCFLYPTICPYSTEECISTLAINHYLLYLTVTIYSSQQSVLILPKNLYLL